jgi:hypothetical protein
MFRVVRNHHGRNLPVCDISKIMELDPPVLINHTGEVRVQTITNFNRYCLIARRSRNTMRIHAK